MQASLLAPPFPTGNMSKQKRASTVHAYATTSTTNALSAGSAIAFNVADCGCCHPCECEACLRCEFPPQLQVDVSGVADGTCSDCEAFNGTWIVDYQFCTPDTTLPGIIFGPCDVALYYTYYTINVCGSARTYSLAVRIAKGSASQRHIHAVFNTIPTSSGPHWTLTDTDDTYDCTAFMGLSLPNSRTEFECTTSASTAAVTTP